jgi:predicted Zn-dependent peptidase
MIREYTFPNGLKLVYSHRPYGNLSAINIFVRVGSNYESYSLQGGSHFLEHMMFKGTHRLGSAKAISTVFDEIGAYLNAYTDKNLTCYVAKCESTYTSRCIETFADMLRNSVMDPIEFELEKNVVVEEIIRTKDNQANYISDKILELVFKGSALALPVGSTEEFILKYNRNDVLDYYHTFYKPSNMVISICTSLTFKEVQQIVSKSYFGTWITIPFQIPKKYTVNTRLDKQVKPLVETIDRDIEQIHIALGFRTVNQYSNDRYILELIKYILVGNMSSRLFINLREKNGLTYNVGIDNMHYETTGCFNIITSVDRDRLLDYKDISGNSKPGAIPVLLDTLKQLVEKGTKSNELEKIKGFLKGSLSLELEDSQSISDYNGRQVLLDYPEFVPLETLYTIFKSIEKRDIEKVLRKVFCKKNMSLFLIGKKSYIDLDKIENLLDSF